MPRASHPTLTGFHKVIFAHIDGNLPRSLVPPQCPLGTGCKLCLCHAAPDKPRMGQV